MSESSATAFLRRYGRASLVSLGCGQRLNRIDNHLRLMTALDLSYYVGIDCVPHIDPPSAGIFQDQETVAALLTEYYRGEPQKFWQAVKLFPATWVEDLQGIPCAAVVCQRVYPGCGWEEVICSLTPQVVLQEDLHGCERQQLRGRGYVRTWTKIRGYGLQPFRPWPIFPWERNLILWRRRDFGGEEVESSRWRALWRLAERLIG